MTPTKESVETGSSVADLEGGPQAKSRPKPESAHLRADAVSLEIPIRAHGSLVPSAGSSASAQAQPFDEQTTTMIVFPQGSVLKMSTAVSAGQVMVLTNLKSRQDAICRVVKVRAFGKAQSYVEIEFTAPQPGYWGVYFPSDGPEVARLAAPPSPQAAESASVAAAVPQPPAPPAPPAISSPARETAAPAPAAQTAAPVSHAAAPAPASSSSMPIEPQPASHAEAAQPFVAPVRPLAPPKLPESSFVSIGAKEDVLAPADSTRTPRPASFSSATLKSQTSADTEISDAIDALIAPSTRPVPSAPQRADVVDSTPFRANEPAARTEMFAKSAPARNAAAETSLPVPKQMFGVTLDSASSISYQASRRSSGSWIPVGIAAMLVAGAAGAYYLHLGPFAGAAAARTVVASASVPAAQSSISQPVPQEASPMPGTTEQAPNSAVAAMPSDTAPADTSAVDSQKETAALAPENRPGDLNPFSSRRAASTPGVESRRLAAESSQPNGAMPSTFGVLNSRPIVRTRSGENSVGAAPALYASGSPSISNGSLPALAAPVPNLPAPPKPAPTAPIRVGGRILPPRLVSSVLPLYPPIAQQAGVSGTVVIDTTIDKNGDVAKTRVISGPELLRGAALSALRQWKYEPSRLNGQPIAVEMIVSIRFH